MHYAALDHRVDGEASPLTKGSARQPITVTPEPGAVVLPVRAPPDDGEADHLGVHAMSIVENGNRRRLVFGLTLILELDEHVLRLRLDRVVHQLVQGGAGALVAYVPDAPDEGVTDRKAELEPPLLDLLYVLPLPLEVCADRDPVRIGHLHLLLSATLSAAG